MLSSMSIEEAPEDEPEEELLEPELEAGVEVTPLPVLVAVSELRYEP